MSRESRNSREGRGCLPTKRCQVISGNHSRLLEANLRSLPTDVITREGTRRALTSCPAVLGCDPVRGTSGLQDSAGAPRRCRDLASKLEPHGVHSSPLARAVRQMFQGSRGPKQQTPQPTFGEDHIHMWSLESSTGAFLSLDAVTQCILSVWNGQRSITPRFAGVRRII